MKKIYLITSLLLATVSPVWAADDFFTSWKASSYTPYFYQGKVLPGVNADVIVNFELIHNGQPVDLTNKLVRWYVDSNLVKSGLNLKNFVFHTNALKGGDYQIKISLPKYNQGNDLDYFFTIPAATPEVIIDSPYYNNRITTGTSFFRALMYFFDFNKLSDSALTWSVNGSTATTDPNQPDVFGLKVSNLGLGEVINLNLTAKNQKNNFEFAKTAINLKVQ